VSFISYTEQFINSSGIFKDVIISLLSTLGLQEKLRLSERVKAGLRKSNKKSGRRRLPLNTIHEIKEFKSLNYSNRAIAKELKISHPTVAYYLKSV